MSIIKYLILLIILSSCSCSKEERLISPTELWQMAKATGEEVELVPITDPSQRVLCAQYNMPGCVKNTGKRIKVRRVEFLTIQFEKESQAREAALKIDQWYAGNWMFDEVTDEPVIEHFLMKYFDARRPSKEKSLEDE